MERIKKWFIQRKTYILIAAIGALGGFLYWKFVGCESGTCAITSVWWRTTIYGGVMGWLLGGMLNDKLRKQKNDNED